MLQATCDANYVFSGLTMNTPGSTNDRKAWSAGGWEERIAKLPGDYYILGDAGYGPSEKMITPYPGTGLERSRDVTNYYQSQGRMAIEQSFGILVRFVVCNVVGKGLRWARTRRDKHISFPLSLRVILSYS